MRAKIQAAEVPRAEQERKRQQAEQVKKAKQADVYSDLRQNLPQTGFNA